MTWLRSLDDTHDAWRNKVEQYARSFAKHQVHYEDLLDPDFEGGFSAEEAALKANLVEFQQRLAANELARQSKGFGRVLQMLQRLGDRSEY